MTQLEIYGTLGPSCKDEETIYQLFQCGMTGMRLNLSHVNLDDVKSWLEAFSNASKRYGIQPDLLIDMQGPELRLGKVDNLLLEKNQVIDLSTLPIPKIVMDAIENEQEVFFDDGKIGVRVIDKPKAIVFQEGVLKSNKSIALPNIQIDMPTLTEKDLFNISIASSYGVTGLMQPFVRNKNDLIVVKEALKNANASHIKLYAKIENKEGFDQLDELIEYSDHIIIARGDLGNSVGLIQLPSYQKKIEQTCKEKNKPYMVVTEMLYTMQKNPVPTRAEVSDIYHAIYHGASSIMLTGETAAGQYPVEAMRYFVECAKVALKDREEMK